MALAAIGGSRRLSAAGSCPQRSRSMKDFAVTGYLPGPLARDGSGDASPGIGAAGTSTMQGQADRKVASGLVVGGGHVGSQRAGDLEQGARDDRRSGRIEAGRAGRAGAVG